jgi:hypothetical protein
MTGLPFDAQAAVADALWSRCPAVWKDSRESKLCTRDAAKAVKAISPVPYVHYFFPLRR